MRFAEITGNTELKAALAKAVDNGRVPHALMLGGRPGYGTLPIAVAFARYLNCDNPSGGDSCGECPSCRKYAELVHPDLHFVFPVKSSNSATSKNTSDTFIGEWRELWKKTNGWFSEADWYSHIGMDNQQGIISRGDADNVIRKLSLKSFEGRYKVVIVWLPERMRTEAANALLKILEEPWDRTVFILVPDDQRSLLSTIVSRTQHLQADPLGLPEVAGELTSAGLADADTAIGIARAAQGDLLEARELASDTSRSENFGHFSSLMRLCYKDRHQELLDWADSVASLGREKQKMLVDYSVGMIRESYIANTGIEQITYLWGPEKEFTEKFSPFIGNHNVEKLVEEFERVRREIVQNGNPRIIFTHFALTVSKLIKKLP